MVCVLLLTVMFLFGCNKKENKATDKNNQVQQLKVEKMKIVAAKPPIKPTAKILTEPKVTNNTSLLNCNKIDSLTPVQQFACMGERAWETSGLSDQNVKSVFVKAYEQGMLDAQQAKTVNETSLEEQYIKQRAMAKKSYQQGYQKGYQSVVHAYGIKNISCHHKKQQTEFEKHWCVASNYYENRHIGPIGNPLLKDRFIFGYLSGLTIAMTLPSSMETLMQDGKHNIEDFNAMSPLNNNSSEADKIFHKGLVYGFSVMMKKMQQSVDHIMKQMNGTIGN